MSAASSSIQPAISSGVKVRGSGSGAPSDRSLEARKSISSCFSAGDSPAAADSISASVTIRTSVHRAEPACQGNPQAGSSLGKIRFGRDPLRSLGATSCDLLRSSACVGFCVALARDLTFSRGKHRLFSTLLGELRPLSQEVARSRRMTQVVLRLVFLMGMPFCRCDALLPPASAAWIGM